MPIVSIWRVPEKSSLSPLLPLTNRLERARRGLWRRIPPFWEGKHRVRLYAGHRSGALPRTRPLRGTRRSQAKAAGLTVTDYLCYSGLGKEIVRVDGLEQVLTELKAQGRNLNQLTTLANMGKVTVVYGDRFAESYQQISEQLRQLLREVT